VAGEPDRGPMWRRIPCGQAEAMPTSPTPLPPAHSSAAPSAEALVATDVVKTYGPLEPGEVAPRVAPQSVELQRVGIDAAGPCVDQFFLAQTLKIRTAHADKESARSQPRKAPPRAGTPAS